MSFVDNFTKVYSFISPVIDIAILAFVLYKAILLIMNTNGVQIITSAIFIAGAYVLAIVLNLETLLWILNTLMPGLFIAFAIVFQPELRKIFVKLGQTEWLSLNSRTKHTYIDSALIAAEILSKMRRGMLLVFMRHTKFDDIIEPATKLNADLTSNLLVTIFGHDTPLHDGACFVQGGKIIAAGCFLPLSERNDIRKSFGTRHRAALGISEVSDCVVLIVSEESGAISLAYDSNIYYDLSIEQITQILEKKLEVTPEVKIKEASGDEN